MSFGLDFFCFGLFFSFMLAKYGQSAEFWVRTESKTQSLFQAAYSKEYKKVGIIFCSCSVMITLLQKEYFLLII